MGPLDTRAEGASPLPYKHHPHPCSPIARVLEHYLHSYRFRFLKWKPNAHILEVNYAEKYFIFLLRQMIFK